MLEGLCRLHESARTMSLFGSRRRKLLLGVAAVGVLLAALVGFSLAPDGSADDSIRIHLEGTETNDMGGIIARFAVTKRGKNRDRHWQFFHRIQIKWSVVGSGGCGTG